MIFASAEDLETPLVGALQGFLDSRSGEQATAAVRDLDAGSVIAIRVSDPDTDVWVDFEAGTAGLAEPSAWAAELIIDGDSIHHLALNQLAPVQVARAVEEHRLDASGSFEILLALVGSLDVLGEHWRASLRECGRENLLEVPAPPAAETYSVDTGLQRQGHKPPWAGHGKRAVSKPTRRAE
jgi:hypothetical protein